MGTDDYAVMRKANYIRRDVKALLDLVDYAQNNRDDVTLSIIRRYIEEMQIELRNAKK